MGQQENISGERAATSRPKYIPKPPKKKRKFPKTIKRNPAKSLTTPSPQDVAGLPPTTEKELSYEQLQRKVRDLVVLNRNGGIRFWRETKKSTLRYVRRN